MRNCPICYKSYSSLMNIMDIKLSLVNEINLNNNLHVKLCNDCCFYFSDSNNTQDDYNNYYLKFNNYQQQNYCLDKDIKCVDFICKNINNDKIKTIIDYGSGNGAVVNLLKSQNFTVDNFDIGMKTTNIKYDLLILSHVLEHIFNLSEFINTITKNINDDGLLYIEVPNAEYYDKFTDICPLQEINIEHINFFSKYSLNKLLVQNNYYAITLIDDYFTIKNSKYYVIRGIFTKNVLKPSFNDYLENGLKQIEQYNFIELKKYKNIYVYGCGQFLFKIFDKIQNNCNIINIIDDNPCYLDKKLENIEIINYDLYKENAKTNDIILLTSLIHDDIIKNKIQKINKNITILSVTDL